MIENMIVTKIVMIARPADTRTQNVGSSHFSAFYNKHSAAVTKHQVSYAAL